MSEKLKALIESWNWLPFVLASGHNIEHRRFSLQRLLEVFISGAVSGAIAVLIAFYVLKNDVNHLTSSFSDFKNEIHEWRSETNLRISTANSRLNSLTREFDQHDHGGKSK